ncbi:hypothetical protein [Acidihalobacter ferrooxydans]|uniref:Uncharacterized protein n=1 Tax=Acidihalobacter ferrooxydans TaxID=1765967 RepID=A0A1P8UJ01_9GAMM|nr:hypothetical protein [Acidihalobacter ferrooxydans]APZ43825.1 hypothetical protein BW247_12605 [Acidihalobacter ferrooxydans]
MLKDVQQAQCEAGHGLDENGTLVMPVRCGKNGGAMTPRLVDSDALCAQRINSHLNLDNPLGKMPELELCKHRKPSSFGHRTTMPLAEENSL